MAKSKESPIQYWEKEEYFSKKICVLNKCLYTLGTVYNNDDNLNYYRIKWVEFGRRKTKAEIDQEAISIIKKQWI